MYVGTVLGTVNKNRSIGKGGNRILKKTSTVYKSGAGVKSALH